MNQLCNDHRYAVQGVVKPLKSLRVDLLSHLRRDLQGQPSTVSAIVADVAKYLGSRDVFRATSSAADTTTVNCPRNVKSSELVTRLQSRIDELQLSTGARVEDASMAELRVVAAQIERAKMQEAFAFFEAQGAVQPGRAWQEMSEDEARIIDAMDDALVDLSALRGFAAFHYRSGCAASTIKKKMEAE